MTYTSQHYATYDPNFIDDLEKSKIYVWMAAQWLSNKGYHVTVRKTDVRPEIDRMGEFADDGDIEIIQRIESKHRKIDFTSKDDYPYKTIIIDVAHTFDNAVSKPFAYIIINNSGTHCAIIKADTIKHWIKSTKHDRYKNRDRVFYECPVEFCNFYPFHGTSGADNG